MVLALWLPNLEKGLGATSREWVLMEPLPPTPLPPLLLLADSSVALIMFLTLPSEDGVLGLTVAAEMEVEAALLLPLPSALQANFEILFCTSPTLVTGEEVPFELGAEMGEGELLLLLSISQSLKKKKKKVKV